MNFTLSIPLDTSPEQVQRLQALQQGFAQVCNAVAGVVQQTRVWNRVALHHLTYRQLRERFPQMGSQMVCNAIYSVSRTCRVVFQHPHSPFHLSRLDGKPLPLLRFADSCPVYFDRHTLSIKGGQLSMFTLDGRMRFSITLGTQAESAFQTHKLREIVLAQAGGGSYSLSFSFSDMTMPSTADGEVSADDVSASELQSQDAEIPEYVMVEESL
ncbi:MAG: hypothetical protein L6Q63_02930 [Giesbergeria sp.]|jgi:hypothetical protein|nr:hypothetical protein [Giesbergeria sp.]